MDYMYEAPEAATPQARSQADATCAWAEGEDNGHADNNHPHQPTHTLTDSRRLDWPKVKAMEANYPDLAAIYTTVAQDGLPNALGPRVPVPSNLNIQAWEAIQTRHADDKLVLDGIQYGFSLQYTGPPNPTTGKINNHSSANDFPVQVMEYISKETTGCHDRPIRPVTLRLGPYLTHNDQGKGVR